MVFTFYIGGYPGPFFHLKVVDGFLQCNHALTDKDQPEVINIPIIENAKWNTLITFLSKQKWKENYLDQGIVDGTGWSLEVKSVAVHIKSGGSNAYPPGFKKFLKLLNDVTIGQGLTIS
jgi:hypothetical protein